MYRYEISVSFYILYYYKIFLLRSSAPYLTYCSQQKQSTGSIVSVPLKNTVKEAVVITDVEKPEFETAEITSVSDKVYTNAQMDIAKFISEYYFSSFSEAISLFIPYVISGSGDFSPTCTLLS